MVNSLPAFIKELNELGVRNCSELVTCLVFLFGILELFIHCMLKFGLVMFKVKSLDGHVEPVDAVMTELEEKLKIPLSNVDPEMIAEFISLCKNQLKDAEVDLKDARRRISLAKGPKKKKQPQVENDVSDGDGSASA